MKKEHRSSHEKNTILGLFGSGGFARGVMPILADYAKKKNRNNLQEQCEFFFVDVKVEERTINGYNVISENEFFEMKCVDRYFSVPIADSKIRKKISEICLKNGAKPLTLISPNAIIYDNNEISEGAIICSFSTITSNVKIGKYFHANIYSYVEHDCVIGDYVTFAPNVHCNGNIHIHDYAYIGAGAIIKQGTQEKPLTIGKGAVIGMGAVVTKDVPPFTTVVGNPARPLLISPKI